MTVTCPACKTALSANVRSSGATAIRCEACNHKFTARLRHTIVVIDAPDADETVNPLAGVTRPAAPVAPPVAPAPVVAPATPTPYANESEFARDVRNLYPNVKRTAWSMLGSPWHSGWFIALIVALVLLPFSVPGLFVTWLIVLFFRPGKRAAAPAPMPAPEPMPQPAPRGAANPLRATPSDAIAVGEPLTWVLEQQRRAG